jgi:hypothetical protein
MRRHLVILAIVSAAGSLYDQAQRAPARAANGGADARHVILVVSDGLRWQEVFRGADSSILFSESGASASGMDAARRRFWRSGLAERRAALMPFLWSTLARDGRLAGNRDADSHVDVANAMRFSYPGYNEMLVGLPDPRIDRNDFGPNPNVTVFEWLNRRDGFRGRVAAFGTWDVFHDIFNSERSGIAIHTNGAKPDDILVQRRVLPYLKARAPRALFVGFAETDDWGHEGRYDRFLDAVHAVDGFMAEIWSAVQSDARYRDRTTLIFTADHGRGRTAADWMHHGREIDGAEETFIVMIGPGVAPAAGGGTARYVLGDVARATAAAVGLTYRASGTGVESR